MPEPATQPVREVAVGLIVAEDGRLLLQHRDANPEITGAGLWGFFGGHIEPGEHPAEAFLRELDEELGWRPAHFEPYLTRQIASLLGDAGYGWQVTSHVFAAHLDVSIDALVLGEGQGMALYPPAALPDAIVPGLVSVIETFAASDAYKRVKHRYDTIAATAILVDREGRYLLQHRDDKPWIDNPGMWGSFGGSIEPYESAPDGFLRELQEELSWQPAAFELYASAPFRQQDGRRSLIYIYAAAISVGLDHLVLGEGQGMAFFAPDALPDATQPDYRGLLQRFAQTETYRRMTAVAAFGR